MGDAPLLSSRVFFCVCRMCIFIAHISRFVDSVESCCASCKHLSPSSVSGGPAQYLCRHVQPGVRERVGFRSGALRQRNKTHKQSSRHASTKRVHAQNHGADQARGYAGKYCSKPEKSHPAVVRRLRLAISEVDVVSVGLPALSLDRLAGRGKRCLSATGVWPTLYETHVHRV